MNPHAPIPCRPAALRAHPRHRGAVQLFVTVVLLLVVVMLGITAAVVSNTQYKMVSNVQLENMAFGQAESAAASAESWLYTPGNYLDNGFTTSSVAYLYPLSTYVAGQSPDPLTMTWSDANSLAVNGNDASRYMIEKIGDNNLASGAQVNMGGRVLSGCQMVDIFRISARGTSAKGTVKLIQTIATIPTC